MLRSTFVIDEMLKGILDENENEVGEFLFTAVNAIFPIRRKKMINWLNYTI